MKVMPKLNRICLLCAVFLAAFAAAAQPVILQQPSNQTVTAGGAAIFSVGISSTSVGTFLSYQWQLNGTNLPIGIITTVAGKGTNGYSGDGGVATSAELYEPTGVAVDGTGNLFIADSINNRIRKVSTNGIITTVAGNGTAGFSGDGGVATSAELNLSYPCGLAVDGNGNLFIPDTYNNRIRKVTAGIITTVGPTSVGLNHPCGVAVDSSGNLFIADAGNNLIRKVTGTTIATVAGNYTQGYYGDGGAATSAALNNPSGIAVDGSGSLFIADTGNNLIRKVTVKTITTVAGTYGKVGYFGDGGLATSAVLSYPCGVALDGSGNLFIADYWNNRIRKVYTTLAYSLITTVAGNGTAGFSGDGGLATSAVLNYPCGVALDVIGNPFIADVLNNRIREVKLSDLPASTNPSLVLNSVSTGNAGNYSVVITTSSGSVTSSVASLSVLVPPSIMTQPTNQWVVVGSNVTFSVTASGTAPFTFQWQSNGVSILNATSAILTLSNVQTNAAASYSVTITNSVGSVTSANAMLAVLVPPSNQVQIVGSAATFAVVVIGNGTFFTYQWQLNGINLPNGGLITTVAGNGTSGDIGDELYWPVGVAVDSGGSLFIADTYNHRVCKLTNGILQRVAGIGVGGYLGDGGAALGAWLNSPFGVAVDGSDNLFIADKGNYRIRKVSTNGIITTVAGNGTNGYSGDGGMATNAWLNGPNGVAVDGSGNLFIADIGNNRIRKVSSNGIITTVAGNGTNGYSGDGGAATNSDLNPCGVAVDGSGNLYIADLNNYRIRKVSTIGNITTVAGNGISGYSGDGGMATNAELVYPYGVAVDGSGNLFIADDGNNRIRKVSTNGIITTVAGNGTNGYFGDGGTAIIAEFNSPMGVAVDGSGNLFIADLANNRIRKVSDLPISTSSSFVLNSISSSNSGNYSVVITSSSGSVTSSVASLVVAPVGYKHISRPVLNNGKMRLSFVGLPGTNYALDRSFSLSPANWIPQITNPADVNGNLIFTNAPVSTTNNFWRIRSVP